jgi:hypothetical protein
MIQSIEQEIQWKSGRVAKIAVGRPIVDFSRFQRCIAFINIFIDAPYCILSECSTSLLTPLSKNH